MRIKDVLVMAAIGLLGAACSDDDNKGSQWGDRLEVRKRIWMYLPMINGLM